jgi:hypothetical protein
MRALAAMALLLWVLGAPAARAGSPETKSAAPEAQAPASPDPATAEREHWQARKRELEKAVEDAQARLDRAEATYGRGRRANRMRGDAKVEALKELDEARDQLAAAQQALEDFPEEARHAGVPPGWIR